MGDLTGQYIRDGEYKLIQKLGEGANGIVYRAYQASLDDDVAIKIISAERAKNSDLIRTLRHEAKVLRKLTQYNIIPVYEYWQEEDGSAYLAMRYLRGGTLSKRVEDKGILTGDEVVRLINQVANALAAAHLKGIIHRDVKPGNILLDEDNNAYLGDFGLAKQLDPNSNPLSSEGGAMGTPGYIAPELFSGANAQPQADIFSLGITLYECLAGHHPFAENRFSYLHLDEIELPSLHNLRPDLPVQIDEVINQAIQKNPVNRYSDVLKFAQAISDALRPPNTISPNDHADPKVNQPAPCNRIFISYQRRSSTALAWMIHAKLQDYGIDSFLDLEKMDSGQFKNKIFREIEQRDVFVCLLANTTLKSEWVNREIEHAHIKNKAMIPVFQENFRRPRPLLRRVKPYILTLLGYQGIKFFDEQGVYLQDAIEDLANAICSDRPPTPINQKESHLPIIWIASSLLIVVSIAAIFLTQIPFLQVNTTHIATQTAFALSILHTSDAETRVTPVVSQEITLTPSIMITNTLLPVIITSASETSTPQPTIPPLATDTSISPMTEAPTESSKPITWTRHLRFFYVFGTALNFHIATRDGENTLAIMLNLITNSQYAACVDRTDNPNNPCQLPSSSGFRTGRDDAPVVNITWHDAKKYCTELGGHLPTAAEWDSAAEGIEHVEGFNEWVNDSQVDGKRMLRGSDTMEGLSPTISNARVGFRCVFD